MFLYQNSAHPPDGVQDFPDGAATLAEALVDNPPSDKSSVAGGSASNRAAGYIDKPMGFSSFPKELVPTPKSWAASRGNLVFYRAHDKVSPLHHPSSFGIWSSELKLHSFFLCPGLAC